jgi:DNA-binding SARP family transcriptional activator
MLRVRALGGLEIYRGEERVNASSQSARAREMLLYLLCHPAGSTKEQIGAALWPDADGAKLRNNFHVTVHRLRKTLGASKWIVADGETYAIDRHAAIDFDAEVFERTAKAALRSLAEPELEHAASLYRGDFFASSSSSEWHLGVRDRLRDVYSELLRALGRAKMSAGDFRRAADIYRTLLQIDQLDEQACRNLMTSLGHEGDTAGASLAYRSLVNALRRELDAPPDPATVRLFTKIQASTQ